MKSAAIYYVAGAALVMGAIGYVVNRRKPERQVVLTEQGLRAARLYYQANLRNRPIG